MKKLKFIRHLIFMGSFLLLSLISSAQEDKLCVGHHWSEDEANLKMKEFESTWNDLDSWQDRATMIKQGIIEGMKLDQMPKIKGDFVTILPEEQLRVFTDENPISANALVGDEAILRYLEIN